MTRISYAAVVSLVAGAAVSAPAMAQTADLSYKWREGVTLAYEFKSEMTQETESPGYTASMDITTTTIQTMEVTDVTRGDGEIEVTTDSLELESTIRPGGRTTYDSTNPRDRRRATEPGVAPFAYLVGKTYTMTLNEAGEVANLEGYDRHLRSMLQGMTDPNVQAALSMTMTESAFETQLEQVWHVLPGEEVEVGDTWTTRMAQVMPGMGEIIVEMEFKFAEIDTMEGLDVAVIEVKGTARMGRGGVPGVRIDINESEISGTVHFAWDLGLIVESEMSQDLMIEMSQGGQSMSQTVSSTVQMELVDVQGLDLGGDEPVEDVVEEPAPAAEEPAVAPTPPPTVPPATPPGGRSSRKP